VYGGMSEDEEPPIEPDRLHDTATGSSVVVVQNQLHAQQQQSAAVLIVLIFVLILKNVKKLLLTFFLCFIPSKLCLFKMMNTAATNSRSPFAPLGAEGTVAGNCCSADAGNWATVSPAADGVPRRRRTSSGGG
jgi:hypothetical protein